MTRAPAPAASRLARARASVAVYELMCAELRGAARAARGAGAGSKEDGGRRNCSQRYSCFLFPPSAALAAPLDIWKGALWLEGCGVPLERAMRRSGTAARLPAPLRGLVREVCAVALRHALALPVQLAEIAALASARGLPLIVLKGAARLLAGEPVGTRSVADIDLLATPAYAVALHRLVRDELGYAAKGGAPGHHLPRLERAGALPVEIHTRLGACPSPLDDLIRLGARAVAVAGATVGIPSATALLLHTLEHAAVAHWAHRYRLRDVVDVAGAWTEDVDGDAARTYVCRSAHRAALETLLAAAHELEPRVPRPRSTGGAWNLVRRTGRARLVAAALRGGSVAARTTWMAGVVAEAAPASLARLAGLALRRVTLAALAALAFGCGDPTPPAPLDAPPFVFASDADGNLELYRFRSDTVTRLTADPGDDTDPHVAAGRLVFASTRDGNSEIYVADLDASAPRRVTSHGAADAEPALSPAGDVVAFVSGRAGGTPRLWLVDTLGANPVALATGSSSFVPEHAPAWSPGGDRIAFTSTRTGTSQVWVVAAQGGEAVQVSHESGGAFAPAWSADGAAILYVTGAGTPRIRAVTLGTGAESEFAADPSGVGDPACDPSLCLAVTNPYGADGDLVAVRRSGERPVVVLRRAGKERRPAIIR